MNHPLRKPQDLSAPKVSQGGTTLCLLSLAILLLPQTPGAYNHPEIRWRSVPTEHFTINFYDKTEAAVYATWKIAEEAYADLTRLYDHTPRRKINLSLADYDDYSNGFASWTQPAIMVWVPDAHFDLRGNTTWLRNVITHELTHIISLEKARGAQLFDWTVDLQYFSPSLDISYTEPFVLSSFTPEWLAEGAAQLGAERMQSDCWDTRRDMVLRCAALDGSLLSLDEMGHFTHDALGNEMVYNQGYSFARHLARTIGDEGYAGLWNAIRQSRGRNVRLSRYLRDSHGLSVEDLYRAWRDSLAAAAEQRVPANPTKATILWSGGRFNYMPRATARGDRIGMLTSQGGDGGRTDLVIAENEGRTVVRRVRYAKTSWDFSPDGAAVYYIKSRTPDDSGSFHNDLYRLDLASGKETRLTRSARIYDVTANDDGSTLACVRYDEGAFSLCTMPSNAQTLTTVIRGEMGEPFLTTSFAPTSSDRLVAARVVDGSANLYLVDLTDRTIEPLVVTQAQEESPHWALDGRIYFSADYDGAFDLYSVAPDGGDLRRHTRSVGGAFSPHVAENGVLATRYTSAGFAVVRYPREDTPAAFPTDTNCTFLKLPKPAGKVTIRATPYRPRMLRPFTELTSGVVLFDYDGALPGMLSGDGDGDFFRRIPAGAWSGLMLNKADALYQRAMTLGFLATVETATAVRGQDTQTVESGLALLGSTPPLYGPRGGAAARPHPEEGLRRPRRKQRARNMAFVRRAVDETATTATATDGQGADTVVLPIPYVQALLTIDNHRRTPTIGLEAAAALGFMVAQVTALPYLELQLARDINMGLSADVFVGVAGVGPIGSLLTSAVVRWVRQGYYNEDIAYNLRDITIADITLSPGIVPVTAIGGTSRDGGPDTSFAMSGTFGVGLTAFHSIPVFRYSSASFGIDAGLTRLTENVLDPQGIVDGASERFADLGATARYTFPLLRNINRGRLYADNLYGSLFYQTSLYCNDRFLRNPSSRAFTDSRYAPDNVAVGEWVGAGVELGLIKQHVFARTLLVEGAWDLLGEAFRVRLWYTF